jgi:hypothetical protein
MLGTRRPWYPAGFLTACLVLGVGCSTNQTGMARASPSVSGSPTPPCARYPPEATKLIVSGFLDAYNAGSPDITDRFIAPPGEFQWYGAPGRQFDDDPKSMDRGTLAAYFAGQHAKGDRLELKTFRYNGINRQSYGWAANFDYILIHSMADGSAHEAPGKGALACTSGKIAVWRIASW